MTTYLHKHCPAAGPKGALAHLSELRVRSTVETMHDFNGFDASGNPQTDGDTLDVESYDEVECIACGATITGSDSVERIDR